VREEEEGVRTSTDGVPVVLAVAELWDVVREGDAGFELALEEVDLRGVRVVSGDAVMR